MDFTCTGLDNETYSTKQLCYVCDGVDQVYLSKQGLIDLHCISPQFPLPMTIATAAATEDENESSECDCTPCPDQPPTKPTKLPPGIQHNSEQLKTWLLEYYGSTTFNTCEHRPLPMMTGSPLQMHLDTSAIPAACHKVVQSPSTGGTK